MIGFMLIGKQNEPLFFHHVDAVPPTDPESLSVQMIMHSALDIIDERKKKASSGSPSTFDLYLGQLLQVDDYRVFGHYSNTHIKTVVLCESLSEATDAAVRDVVLTLRGLYIAAIQNPFFATERPLESASFRRKVQQLMQQFNARVAKT